MRARDKALRSTRAWHKRAPKAAPAKIEGPGTVTIRVRDPPERFASRYAKPPENRVSRALRVRRDAAMVDETVRPAGQPEKKKTLKWGQDRGCSKSYAKRRALKKTVTCENAPGPVAEVVGIGLA